MERKPNKVLKFLIIAVSALAALIILFISAVRLYFRYPVRAYYRQSEKAFVIPGLKDNFVAQGISYDASSGSFYICGYSNDEQASPIYIVNKESKKLEKTVRMANPDGTPFTGHAGGLSVYNGKIYVAGGSDCCLYVFSQDQVRYAENNSSVKYSDIIDLNTETDGIGVAFTTIKKDRLFAGEFYKLPQYPTNQSHTVKTDKDINHALIIELDLKREKPEPVSVYSVTDKVQGMAFNEGKIYLSTSWGTNLSNIFIYDEALLISKETMTVLGKELPLYILDNTNLINTVSIAPMSEEIEFVNGKCYTMCESASNKYIFGKLTGGKWCYATKF